MKYVNDFDLIAQYADTIRTLKAKVDDNSIVEINSIMEELGIYIPRHGVPSIDTTSFKICQIIYFMFAYRSDSAKKELIFSPLGNLLLDNLNDADKKRKIFATMLFGMPFSHPYNKMTPDFNIFPYRLIFKLLSDPRLEGVLYKDEVFFHVIWTKSIDKRSYEALVGKLLKFRNLSTNHKLRKFTRWLSLEDSIANALHETNYLFGQLASAGIVSVTRGTKVGVLRHGGFGRGIIPDTMPAEDLAKINRTGKRVYSTDYMTLDASVSSLIQRLLTSYDFTEKPHQLLSSLGRQDYILHLYNFYPEELLEEIGIRQNRIQAALQLSKNINKYSRNQEKGDCYRFEDILADAFNEFDDVTATVIGGSGNTDVECLHLTINEKFAVEAKSTQTKLSGLNAGRLQLHRNKINARYTIVVAPYYKPSVESDIANTNNVIITASTLSNFLYQSTVRNPDGITYEPLYRIIQDSMGSNITAKVNEFVAQKYGIGKSVP